MRSAKVVPRGCSRPLQRAIVDFAADQSFALARMKLLEHYGFEIGESTIQGVALGHAKTVFEAGGVSQDFPQTVGRHPEIVAQTDGGMIPIVEPEPSQKDKRKGKTLSWREAKICLAHAKGSQTPVYDGTIEGGVETAGRKLFPCAVRAGFGATIHHHLISGLKMLLCLGDRGVGAAVRAEAMTAGMKPSVPMMVRHRSPESLALRA